ncbi:type II secretion system protein N [Sandaracinobacter sp. RS1-74]|uniref:type II secretion system protein N n=1 Tax=Sandaracinobacteroides sayramensis TaxID=2913411 RepID=UPI001EDA0CC2|nr:type II secretion system protein N [Sandaracinobacteroides sayramensis]MCG2842238.1 type II secretion system protein N [Sandaracinobacteroides sayramensis]
MRWYWWILILIALVALAAFFLPLSFVLRQAAPGLEAERVEGSIWNGRLRGASYGGIPIGDVDAGLDFGRLLQGEANVRFERLGPRLSGRAGGTLEDRRLEGLNGELPLSILPQGFPPVRLQFEDVSLHLGRRQNCLSASGVVTASLPDLPGLRRVPPLSTTPRCEGDALIVPLNAPDQRLALHIGVAPGGVWKAGLGIRLESPLAAAALVAAGFTPTPEGVRLDSSGTFDDLRALEQAARGAVQAEKPQDAGLTAEPR